MPHETIFAYIQEDPLKRFIFDSGYFQRKIIQFFLPRVCLWSIFSRFSETKKIGIFFQIFHFLIFDKSILEKNRSKIH